MPGMTQFICLCHEVNSYLQNVDGTLFEKTTAKIAGVKEKLSEARMCLDHLDSDDVGGKVGIVRKQFQEVEETLVTGAFFENTTAGLVRCKKSCAELLSTLVSGASEQYPNPIPNASPNYWEWDGAGEILQGWHVIPLLRGKDDSVLDKLAMMLHVPKPSELGVGKDCHSYPRKYHKLQLHCAWRIENPKFWARYQAKRQIVAHEAQGIRRQLATGSIWESVRLSAHCHAELPGGLNADAIEIFSLSGTKPEFLYDILTQGLNEKIASMGGLLGPAIYLAHEATKIDQYTKPDFTYEMPGLEQTHARLFRAGGFSHPGKADSPGGESDIFYCLVVRTTLGWGQCTKDGKTNWTDGSDLWHDTKKRELAKVPSVNAPVRYHSLLAEAGRPAEYLLKRFQEIAIYSNDQCYIEYLIAYQRV